MTANELVERLKVRPFSPLVVQMRDGRAYEIRRPGMAIVTPTVIVIGVTRSNGSRLAERIVRCPINEIASVVQVEAAQS
jgi:hypothetical protein